MELCQIKHQYLLTQHNVLKITKTKSPDLATKNSLSVCDGNGGQVNEVETNDDSNDKYLVVDFNTVSFPSPTKPVSPSSPSSTDAMMTMNRMKSLHERPDLLNVVSKSNNPSISRVTSNRQRANHLSHRVVAYFMTDALNFDMLQMEISNKVPTSLIIKENQTDLYAQMNGLYNKYVMSGSDYEINIPFLERNEIKTLLQAYNESVMLKQQDEQNEVDMIEGDLFWLMDKACLNIIRLLISPFGRFKLGARYKDYINSMEHQATTANYEFSKIRSDQVTAIVPSFHAAHSYERLKETYQR